MHLDQLLRGCESEIEEGLPRVSDSRGGLCS